MKRASTKRSLCHIRGEAEFDLSPEAVAVARPSGSSCDGLRYRQDTSVGIGALLEAVVFFAEDLGYIHRAWLGDRSAARRHSAECSTCGEAGFSCDSNSDVTVRGGHSTLVPLHDQPCLSWDSPLYTASHAASQGVGCNTLMTIYHQGAMT